MDFMNFKFNKFKLNVSFIQLNNYSLQQLKTQVYVAQHLLYYSIKDVRKTKNHRFDPMVSVSDWFK